MPYTNNSFNEFAESVNRLRRRRVVPKSGVTSNKIKKAGAKFLEVMNIQEFPSRLFVIADRLKKRCLQWCRGRSNRLSAQLGKRGFIGDERLAAGAEQQLVTVLRGANAAHFNGEYISG